VHAQQQGHPLVMDERYGDPTANTAAKAAGLKRLFLHAQSISFPDESGNDLHFTAPLADDLQAFLERLEKRSRQSQ
jgi:23S rRNA pseudouridine955/2504/2580 synthase